MATSPQGVAYLDSSALVKLLLREAETDALRGELGAWPARGSSRLAEVEVSRVAAREGIPTSVAAELLAGLALYRVDPVIPEARRIATGRLRSLDAVHIATALSMGANLGVLVTYDGQMQEEAERLGLSALAPT